VKFKRQFTYDDGRTVLRDAEMTLPDRNGRTMIIRRRDGRSSPRPQRQAAADRHHH
jgi:hypothetical protein